MIFGRVLGAIVRLVCHVCYVQGTMNASKCYDEGSSTMSMGPTRKRVYVCL